MLFQANGFFDINIILMVLLHVIRLAGYVGASLNNMALILMRLSLLESNQAPFALFSVLLSLPPGLFINKMLKMLFFMAHSMKQFTINNPLDLRIRLLLILFVFFTNLYIDPNRHHEHRSKDLLPLFNPLVFLLLSQILHFLFFTLMNTPPIYYSMLTTLF